MVLPWMKFLWVSEYECQQYLPHRNVCYYLLAFLIDMKINLSRTKMSIINQLWYVNAVLILEK